MENLRIAVVNGNPTPPSSPITEDHGSSSSKSIPFPRSSERQAQPDLPPTPSSSSQSTDNAPRVRSPGPKAQGGGVFYSERNPIPKVEHFPWESIYRGPVGIYHSPMGPRQQRGSQSSTNSHPTFGRGAMIVESTPVSPTTDHQVSGGDWNGGSRAEATDGQRNDSEKTSNRNGRQTSHCRKEAVLKKHAKLVTDPITREE